MIAQLSESGDPSGLLAYVDRCHMTPLMAAIHESKWSAAYLMLSHVGSNAVLERMLGMVAPAGWIPKRYSPDAMPMSALMYAVESEHQQQDMVRILLSDGRVDMPKLLSQVDEVGMTAFMKASQQCDVDLMRLLLEHPNALSSASASLAARDYEGNTPLMIVAATFQGYHAYTIEHQCKACKAMAFLLRRKDLFPTDLQVQDSRDLKAVIKWMRPVLDWDEPVECRDECVRLLINLGAPFMPPVVTRLYAEELKAEIERLTRQLESTNHVLFLDAVVGLAQHCSGQGRSPRLE
jgi:hypothetical protein